MSHHATVAQDVVPERERWVKIGLWLVGATMVYNSLEAVVALWAGMAAHSIALIGFGLDSVIELAAAAVLLWRLRVESQGRDPEDIEDAERKVHWFVGVTFIALALYVTGQSGWTLWAGVAAAESMIGIILTIISLIVMPAVALGKMRAARHIGSGALKAEAKETLACSYLSLCLFLGLGANAVLGWWWADPVAALLMVPWLVKEGVEGIAEKD